MLPRVTALHCVTWRPSKARQCRTTDETFRERIATAAQSWADHRASSAPGRS